MKAQIRLPNGVALECNGSDQMELFTEMASSYEVFAESKCGICGSTAIKPVVRVIDENAFPEYQCQEPACRAKLTLGQNKKGGGLFPKRKLIENGPEQGKPDMEKGVFGKHNGWTKYKGVPKSAPPTKK